MNLGDRMKSYEKCANPRLTPRVPVFIRVDGRAFHTFLKGFTKPFSGGYISTMVDTVETISKDMQNFRVAYVQSDEATFMLHSSDPRSEFWFDNKQQKIASISASLMTANFNNILRTYVGGDLNLAAFDARAFNVPESDAVNAFLWRVKDWKRNSLQMYCRAHFSHKSLIGKNTEAMYKMLEEAGIPAWQTLEPRLRNGTFIFRDGTTVSEFEPTYEGVSELFCHKGVL